MHGMRIALLLAAVATPVLGCSCAHFDACRLAELPILFVGEVVEGGITSIREDPWYAPVTHVRFRVIERFRGVPDDKQTVDVALTPSMGMCNPIPYVLGKRYVVAPQLWKGNLTDGACSAARDVDRVPDDLRLLREYFAASTFRKLMGRVAATDRFGLTGYLLSIGEAKPLAGARVSAVLGEETYSAVTDADGRYTLDLPQAGRYRVRVDARPYAAEQVMEIPFPLKGCFMRDFGVTSGSTISGKIFDEKGQLTGGGRVGLIDLDAPSKGDIPPVVATDLAERDSTFRFENVPLGRYLVVFNPSGPESDQGPPRGLPYETTYYPVGSARATARPVEIRAAGEHHAGIDLIAGKPVAFRKVTVRIRFPDGAPMVTAQIMGSGEPLDAGDLPWRVTRIADKQGSVSFFAPANRRLKIELRDWHERDLKAAYAASYEPGTGDVVHEIVVRD
jgi:hypothetical protein